MPHGRNGCARTITLQSENWTNRDGTRRTRTGTIIAGVVLDEAGRGLTLAARRRFTRRPVEKSALMRNISHERCEQRFSLRTSKNMKYTCRRLTIGVLSPVAVFLAGCWTAPEEPTGLAALVAGKAVDTADRIGGQPAGSETVGNTMAVPGFLGLDYVCGGVHQCFLTPDVDDLDGDGDTEELILLSDVMVLHVADGGAIGHMHGEGSGMMGRQLFGSYGQTSE